MIQATQAPPPIHYSRQPMYERPPTRFEHRSGTPKPGITSTTTTSKRLARSNTLPTTTTTLTTSKPTERSPAELIRSWEAFDKLFDQAFAPKAPGSTAGGATDSQYAPSAWDTPKQTPRKMRSTKKNRDTFDESFSQLQTPARSEMYEPSRTGQTWLYEETPSRFGRTPSELYNDDGESIISEEIVRPNQSRTGQTRLYEETPARTFSEFSELFDDDDGATGITGLTTSTQLQRQRHRDDDRQEMDMETEMATEADRTPMTAQTPLVPGGYPRSRPTTMSSYPPQQQTPFHYPQMYPAYDDEKRPSVGGRAGGGGGGLHVPPRNDDAISSADEDFERLWNEAEANRKKRMTRTVTRRRLLQHGTMSPNGTVSSMQMTAKGPDSERALRRKKSRFHLYRNGNADYMTATFDVPDVRKEDVHVAFQNSQLTITWESTIVTERRSDSRTVVRERKERKYARTLPLPPGTEFPDIKAYLEDGVLTVMYPKFPTRASIAAAP